LNVGAKVATSALGSYAGSSFAGSKRPVSQISQGSGWTTQDSVNFFTQDDYDRLGFQVKRGRYGGKGRSHRLYHPDVPRGMSFGSRSKKPRVTSQNIVDMIAPLMTLNSQYQEGECAWGRGAQGLLVSPHVTCTDVNNYIAKMQDSRNGNPMNQVDVTTTSSDYTFWFQGQSNRYTIMNSSNNDIYLDILMCKPKKPTSLTPEGVWSEDLAADDTVLNAVAPVQTTDRSIYDIGTRPGNTGHKFNLLYRKRYLGRRLLKPGEEFVYTHKIAPFRYNIGAFKQHVDTTNSAGNDQALYFERTEFLMFIGHSQVVSDSVDTDNTYGSGKLSLLNRESVSFRAMPSVKTHQYSYVNLLPTVFTTEQHINEDTEGMQSYHAV
jgi:hypothetical protein